MEYVDSYESDSLFEDAIEIYKKIESGELESEDDKIKMASMSSTDRDNFHMKKLEQAEGLMCLLLAAARDKARILELVLVPGRVSRR